MSDRKNVPINFNGKQNKHYKVIKIAEVVVIILWKKLQFFESSSRGNNKCGGDCTLLITNKGLCVSVRQTTELLLATKCFWKGVLHVYFFCGFLHRENGLYLCLSRPANRKMFCMANKIIPVSQCSETQVSCDAGVHVLWLMIIPTA